LPNAAFFRTQADAYCRLAEVIETGEAVTTSSLILAEELRGLARDYHAQAERLLIENGEPYGTRLPAKRRSAGPEAGAPSRSIGSSVS
jgi:hypothetical protein